LYFWVIFVLDIFPMRPPAAVAVGAVSQAHGDRDDGDSSAAGVQVAMQQSPFGTRMPISGALTAPLRLGSKFHVRVRAAWKTGPPRRAIVA
jgi:hypothetical protein